MLDSASGKFKRPRSRIRLDSFSRHRPLQDGGRNAIKLSNCFAGLKKNRACTGKHTKVTWFKFIVIVVDFQDYNLRTVVFSNGKSYLLRIIERLWIKKMISISSGSDTIVFILLFLKMAKRTSNVHRDTKLNGKVENITFCNYRYLPTNRPGCDDRRTRTFPYSRRHVWRKDCALIT